MLSGDGYGLLPIREVQPSKLLTFDCGKPRLNDFLTKTAVAMYEARLGLTTVIFHADFDGVVGYFTLANDAIVLNESEKFELGLNLDVTLTSFPAVKIGRLAIASKLQGMGTGTAVLDIIKGTVLDSTSLSSARLLVVDADNDEAVLRFYEQRGFKKSLWSEKIYQTQGGRKRPPTKKMLLDILGD